MRTTEIEQKIIAEARSWVGTKWMHSVALKGYRTDCIQFIICIGKKFGWVPEDYKALPYTQDYALHNDSSLLKQEIAKFLEEVTPLSPPLSKGGIEGGLKGIEGGLKVGDIVLFKFGRCASHAGIYVGGNRVVHSHIRQGVIEDDIQNIKKPIDSVWRFNAQKTA